MEDAVGGSLTLERKRKLMDVSKDFAIKMLKLGKDDRGRDKGKGLPGVSEAQEPATEPTANLASIQVHEEGGSLSSTLASVSKSEGGNRGQDEAQPTAAQTVYEPNQPELDLHSMMAQTLDFNALDYVAYDSDPELDFKTLFAAYEDRTTLDWNRAASPPVDPLGDGSGAVDEGEAREVVREAR